LGDLYDGHPADCGVRIPEHDAVFSCYNGVWTSFFAEQFPAPVLFTGMAVSNQLGNLLAGFAPMVAAMLLVPGPSGWLPVAIFGAVAAGIAAIAVTRMRETSRTPTELLGGPRVEALRSQLPLAGPAGPSTMLT
jgi:hypothetical protein